MLLALCIRRPVASQMVRDGETLSFAWSHHDHHESIDIHRCSQNGHVCLNSALHKLILHVHVRCWDFTIVPVSALGVTLEDMGKMHQSPTIKPVGFLGRHVLLLVMRHDIEDVMCTSRVRAVIDFRSGFSRREIFSVYLWCWWQKTKIERRNSMRRLWIKV